MAKSKKLSILVYSCWKNRDMWEVFSVLFKKYWDDCYYNVILITDHYNNREETLFDKVVEKDGNWYSMIMEGIVCADTPYIMLWMDDYLLCDYVRNDDIEKYLDIVQKYNAANLRLIESPSIPVKRFGKNNQLGYYEPGTAYSMCTQVGIWDIRFLKKHIKKEWSAWDFERKGSIEIKDYSQPLLSTRGYTFPYEEGVRKGKWMDNGVRLCQRNNISLDFSKRNKMSSFALAWIYFKGGLLELNPTFVVKVQNIIARIREIGGGKK